MVTASVVEAGHGHCLDELRIQVATTAPVAIKSERFALEEGLDKLKEIANLPSIASEGAVSAILDFRRRP